MNAEEKKVYQRELMRKRRASNKSNGESNIPSNNLTEPNGISNNLVRQLVGDGPVSVEQAIVHLDVKLEALTQRVRELEETVAKLAASQAKVSVVPGSSLKKVQTGVSKDDQVNHRMIDNSPLGRMFRGET